MSISWIKNINVLSYCLNHINDTEAKKNSIDKYWSNFEGLNLLCKEYYYQENYKKYNQDQYRAERKSFSQLLKENLDHKEKQFLINSKKFIKFLEINPTIMDEEIRRADPAYNPNYISTEVREKASKDHIKLKAVYKDFKNNQTSINFLMEKICNLLYVVRSNIAHGEKTPKGPDVDKSERDINVCNIAFPLLDLIIAILLGYPKRRIAFYNTLKPGGINNIFIKDLKITPYKGFADGYIYKKKNYHFYNWQLNNKKIEVFIYEPITESKMIELDRFEGKSYKRILVPVEIDGKSIVVSNIYIENKPLNKQ